MPNTARVILAATAADNARPPIAFDAEQTDQLLTLLGLPIDDPTIDAEAILATLTDLASAEGAGGDDTKPSSVAAAASKLGLTLLDADSVAKMRADAEEGRQIKAAAARADIEAKVDTAINRGAITPARRDHWLTLLSADPAMADVLAATADSTAVPITERGYNLTTQDGTNPGSLTDAAEWFRP